MFAEDTGLVHGSGKKMQKLAKEIRSVCKRIKIATNVGKSKVMKIGNNRIKIEMNISINNSTMEEAEYYRYLGVDIAHDGKRNK